MAGDFNHEFMAMKEHAHQAAQSAADLVAYLEDGTLKQFEEDILESLEPLEQHVGYLRRLLEQIRREGGFKRGK